MAFARRVMRSTPLRQTVLIVIVVAVVNLASLGAAWVTLRGNAEDTLKNDLSRDMASLDVSASPGALRTLVQARARVTDPTDTVFVFLGNDGGITGNARAVIDGGDVGFTSTAPDRALSDHGYVHQVRRLSGGVLIVAKGLGPVAALDRTFLILLMFSTIPTVLISFVIGAFIARTSSRRVGRIGKTLDRIAGGDLAARVGPKRGSDDLAHIGARVDRMAAKQQAATEALRQVTTDIAHDLRTPLQRIGVTLEELERKLPEGETHDLAVQAGEEADRAVAVFGALLQIAQIEGGQGRREMGPVDLAAVARQIAELYEPAAEDRGDRLALDLPEGVVNVTGDSDLIGQAMANLVENAMRHGPEGGEITIRVARDGTGAKLSVADTGPGIPEEERDKVLRRLYRLERSRTTPGNGLGLALVAAIADRHGADLELGDNAPGLIVTMRFPGA
ncbi:HAMP domain-containing sensor histidine kinase [Maritimibacter dapengensis]|uniref:histidine kinase n=1 Tax=Maritimibacter dapengensis TaxID=2836868 RepID=A0ABS6T121_9RHOB|nr:HAMP domain-containing sensor histidine kinase [Maritimibacter dapengensis]MBV7378921.1 HAMP domain-containing histidine kinase [Maritimibacter dapengensis]